MGASRGPLPFSSWPLHFDLDPRGVDSLTALIAHGLGPKNGRPKNGRHGSVPAAVRESRGSRSLPPAPPSLTAELLSATRNKGGRIMADRLLRLSSELHLCKNGITVFNMYIYAVLIELQRPRSITRSRLLEAKNSCVALPRRRLYGVRRAWRQPTPAAALLKTA